MAWTTHGHQIPGTPIEFRPTNWAKVRCGGPTRHCPKCIAESVIVNYERLDPRFSADSEGIVSNEELQTLALVRKPFYVTAVQVTEANMEAVAKWCGGDVRTTDRSRTRKLIKCVHVEVLRATVDWQKQARVGDWVVRAGAGYKVYTDKALKNSFDVVAEETETTEGELKTQVLVDCD